MFFSKLSMKGVKNIFLISMLMLVGCESSSIEEGASSVGGVRQVVGGVIIEAPPSIASISQQLSFFVGKPAYFSFYNTGGSIVSCSVTSGTIPTPLEISSKCEVSGTPASSSPLSTYQVTALNDHGSDTATVSFSIERSTEAEIAPNLASISQQLTFTVSSPVYLAFTNTQVVLLIVVA